MDPDLRLALLATGLLFCGGFAFMTLSVASDSGFDIFTVVSLLIVFMIGAGLVGAIRNPPPDE
jgi:hypothetical protein